jgi:hypothetical protein
VQLSKINASINLVHWSEKKGKSVKRRPKSRKIEVGKLNIEYHSVDRIAGERRGDREKRVKRRTMPTEKRQPRSLLSSLPVRVCMRILHVLESHSICMYRQA